MNRYLDKVSNEGHKHMQNIISLARHNMLLGVLFDRPVESTSLQGTR